MKFSDQIPAFRCNRTVLTILTIVFALQFFSAKADEITLPIGNAPPMPGPTIPTLLPDDLYVTYFYAFSGTGFWDQEYDPPGAGDLYI
jgi:hypothetical protein